MFRVGRCAGHDGIDTNHAVRGTHERVPRDAVTHGGRRVVTRRAEVAVAVDQWVPQRPGLGHPDQGVVDGRVTVRVELTHHVTDDAGALHVAAVRAVAGVVHRVEDLAVYRLEPVPYVRQG